MARKEDITGYHVRVDHPRHWPYTMDQLKAHCEEIAANIRRHDDDVHVEVVADTESVCGYCGAPWTELDNSPDNGGCCERDMKNMPGNDI